MPDSEEDDMEEDSDYVEERSESEKEDTWEWDEDEEEHEDEDSVYQLPPVPPTPTPKRAELAFSVLQVRAELTSRGKFSPIHQTRELLRAIMGHPLVLGCASKENQLITPKTFPTKEAEFKNLVQLDFSSLSASKHKMSVVFDIATKERLDITELKTDSILTHLKQNKIFLDSHRYMELSTAEIGFFMGMHDKITNRDNLHEMITSHYVTINDDESPEFEVYPKNVYCRFGHNRAFARVLAMRCGRSDAKEMQDFLCTLANRKVFGKAEFIPQGIPPKLLLRKLHQQNKYIANTTAFPIHGFDTSMLRTEVRAGDQTLPLEDYLVRCAKAEKIEPTRSNDRWLLLVSKTAYESAVKFVDNDLVQLFESHDLPRHPIHNIPHRPGSRYTRSKIYNQYTEAIDDNTTIDRQFLKPQQRTPQTRLEVSYAAVAATQPSKQQTPKSTKTPGLTAPSELQRVRQSVREQLKNTSINMQADLTSQVKALQAQITALQQIITTLQQQVSQLTTATSTTQHPTQVSESQSQSKKTTDETSSSPRKPAMKRPRTTNSEQNKTEKEPNFEDSMEDPTLQDTVTQPTPSTDPNHGLDPGEPDST